MKRGLLMKFSDDFIKESFDKARQEETPEALPEIRIKKKPGPKPGFKRKPKTPDAGLEKNCDINPGSVNKTEENATKMDENVQKMDISVNKTTENVNKADDSDMKIYEKGDDLHVPLQSKELVRKQLEEDLVIIAKEVNELLDRRDAIRKFLKSWE